MNDDERIRWARALSVTGWMFLLAYLGVVTGLVRRAVATNQASFEDGLWWQRVEVVSFASLPQNVVVLAPAAAAVVAGTIIARAIVDDSVIWLNLLVRAVAGVCYVAIVIGAFGIIGIFFRSPDNVGDIPALLGRIGGIAMSVAMVRLCLEAERSG